MVGWFWVMPAHIKRSVREQPDTGYWKSLLASFAADPSWLLLGVLNCKVNARLRQGFCKVRVVVWYLVGRELRFYPLVLPGSNFKQ